MGQANSDGGPNGLNNITLDNFFAVFTSGGTPTQRATALTDLFCQDGQPDAQGNPTIPAVGITQHGPNFVGRNEVGLLWNQFTTSFQNFLIEPAQLTLPGIANDVDAPRLYSNDGYPPNANPIPIIGVQTILSGSFVRDWFQSPKVADRDKKDRSSRPLSRIRPVPVGHGGPLSVSIPACLVFAFDGNGDITHLWAYLDRYRLLHYLEPGADSILAGFSIGIDHRQEVLDKNLSEGNTQAR
jgi:hypothetical protein